MKKHTLLTTLATAAVSILLAATLPTLAGSKDAGAAPSDAERAFETFKSLAGEWEGTTANGDAVAVSYEVLAAGSSVVEKFVHSGHGEDHAMLTVYHLDGDDLVLTHYCMAGNQPRMRAAAFAGDEVSFEFVDAANLASPEDGHMHAASFRFDGDDRFATAWTWREDGRDKLTEYVDLERVE